MAKNQNVKSNTSQKSKSAYHHGDLFNSLVEAGIVLIREKGPNAFSMRELAKQAGVSHAAPYRHFEDRNALFAAIAEIGFQRLADQMQKAINDHPDDPRQQLLDAGRHYIRLATDNPEINQLMFGGFLDFERVTENQGKVASSAFDGLLQIIQNGVDAGLYRDETTLHLALTVWSTVHGLSMLITGGQLKQKVNSKKELQKTIDIIQNSLLNGLLK